MSKLKIRIEVNEDILRSLVINYLQDQLGAIAFKAEDVRIEVKSKQNYKSEWEQASFRAIFEQY
jgi:hypothetical protein